MPDSSPLDNFEHIARTRRAVRKFLPDPLPPGILDRLLDAARWAPSGYNLQPAHFIVVEDAEQKKKLRAACMDQKQITEAPASVVFVGDRDVLQNNFHAMMEHEEKAGAMNEGYKKALHKFVPLAFGTGPVGIGWMWKATLPPLLRLGMATPELPAVYRRYWVAKQVMLSAMNFMLAATAAGLGTCPMEGFDEGRVKKALGIPRKMVVVLVVPVGTPAPGSNKKSRLPLERHVHRDGW